MIKSFNRFTVMFLTMLLVSPLAAPPVLADGPPVVILNGPEDGLFGAGSEATLDVTVYDPDGDPMTVTFLGREIANPGHREDFTVVALPDTQYYSEYGSSYFRDQTQWSVDNRDAENIVFVTHLGDIVQDVDTHVSQWIVADEAMSILDGEIPYGLALGNHDMHSDGMAVLYDHYFPPARYEGEPWYGGHHADTNKSNYQLLTISGMDLLFLHLEADYPAGVIAWADAVLTAYPDRLAIVSTHIYLTGGGQLRTNPYYRPDGTSSQDLWRNLLRRHRSVKLVLCGHSCEAQRRIDLNLFGEPVHQILSDYQCRPDGGQGWMRVMTFSPDHDLLHIRTYSPTRDEYLSGSEHEFTLPIDLTPTVSFEILATEAGVASGSRVTFPWTGLGPESAMEWYVVADDGVNTTRSPTWRFSTCWDGDGDGHGDEACGGGDCDDTDPAVGPGVAEVCEDGVDNDCDGYTDAADLECDTGCAAVTTPVPRGPVSLLTVALLALALGFRGTPARSPHSRRRPV